LRDYFIVNQKCNLPDEIENAGKLQLRLTMEPCTAKGKRPSTTVDFRKINVERNA